MPMTKQEILVRAILSKRRQDEFDREMSRVSRLTDGQMAKELEALEAGLSARVDEHLARTSGRASIDGRRAEIEKIKSAAREEEERARLAETSTNELLAEIDAGIAAGDDLLGPESDDEIDTEDDNEDETKP